MSTKYTCLLIAILSIAMGLFESFLCKKHHHNDVIEYYYFLESSIWFVTYLILDEKQKKSA